MHENGILFTPVKCTHAPGFLGLHDTLPCVLIPVSCLFCDLYLPCYYVPHSLRVKASSHDKEQQLEQNCTQTFTWVGSFAYKTFWWTGLFTEKLDLFGKRVDLFTKKRTFFISGELFRTYRTPLGYGPVEIPRDLHRSSLSVRRNLFQL